MNPSARTRFARFYRSRPLIGGALIVLAGLEIFLSTQLDLGKIHVQVGMEGFQALIIPIALVVLGVLVIADPGHRIFYGVIALAIAIYALIGVNLGGFVVGTILGIAGSVVALSWMTPPAADTAEETGADLDVADLEELLAASVEVDQPAEETAAAGAAPADAAEVEVDREPAAAEPAASPTTEPLPFVRRPADPGRTARRGARAIAVAGAVTLGTTALATAAPAQAAHAESPLCTGILSILCPASPTPTPTPTQSPSASPAPSSPAVPDNPAAPGDPAAPSAPVGPVGADPAPSPAPTLPAGVPSSASALLAPQAAATNLTVDAAAPMVATETATLSASYLSQTNGRYVQTVLLRRPDGSTVPALKILGDAGLLKDVRLHGAGAHHGAGIDATQLDVAGPIHFYAASFSGKAFGLLPLHWDVSSPPPVDFPMPPFTDVTVELVYFDAGGQTLTASHITPQ